jgi:uncharacterized membrane protein
MALLLTRSSSYMTCKAFRIRPTLGQLLQTGPSYSFPTIMSLLLRLLQIRYQMPPFVHLGIMIVFQYSAVMDTDLAHHVVGSRPFIKFAFATLLVISASMHQSYADSSVGTKCRYQFCWECLASHKKILTMDNSFHQRSCSFHPRNARG